jgi:hypothetical protein
MMQYLAGYPSILGGQGLNHLDDFSSFSPTMFCVPNHADIFSLPFDPPDVPLLISMPEEPVHGSNDTTECEFREVSPSAPDFFALPNVSDVLGSPISEATNSLDELPVKVSPKKRMKQRPPLEEPEQLAKRIHRRLRNKESAQQSRDRKKLLVDEMAQQAQDLTWENTTLKAWLHNTLAQNEILKRTLHTNGILLPPLSYTID